MRLPRVPRRADRPVEVEPMEELEPGGQMGRVEGHVDVAPDAPEALAAPMHGPVAPVAAGEADLPLSVCGLSVSLTTFKRRIDVLRDVSLRVGPGEVVGVVGEAGSGKSTLVNAIVGTLPQIATRSGEAHVFGRDLSALPFAEAQAMRGVRVGTILSGGRSLLNPMARAGDQIAAVLRDHGVPKRDAGVRAVAMLRSVGIPDPDRRARSYPHELSGGMAQRVVIAVALCLRPQLIVADEPTQGLDVTIQAEVLDLLSSLIEEAGASALIATRDLGIVAQRCTRVAVLGGGRVVEDSPVEEFFLDPKETYSTELLAADRRVSDLRAPVT